VSEAVLGGLHDDRLAIGVQRVEHVALGADGVQVQLALARGRFGAGFVVGVFELEEFGDERGVERVEGAEGVLDVGDFVPGQRAHGGSPIAAPVRTAGACDQSAFPACDYEHRVGVCVGVLAAGLRGEGLEGFYFPDDVAHDATVQMPLDQEDVAETAEAIRKCLIVIVEQLFHAEKVTRLDFDAVLLRGLVGGPLA
jgi:hypothetical protein